MTGDMATQRATTPSAQRRRTHRRVPRVLVVALAAAAVLAGAAPAQARSAATLFTITGRGWGHGIGMSQWGAYGYAQHGWTYKAILKHYYTGIAFGTVRQRPHPRAPARRAERREAHQRQGLHGVTDRPHHEDQGRQPRPP